MGRIIGGVVAGYLVWAGSLMALVLTLFERSSSRPNPGLALAGLAAIGLATGAVVSLVAGHAARRSGVITAAVVSALTIANILIDRSLEPLWFKVAVVAIVGPLTLLVTARMAGRERRRAAASTVPPPPN